MRAGDVVELSIDKLAYGGEGLGRTSGVVVFVPFTAPGDFVRARLTEVKKNFARAELQELVTSSSQRTLPLCKFFGSCGGCHWQHLPLAFQRETKTALVQEAFSRAKLWNEAIPLCAGTESGWNYRRRVQFKIDGNRVGFHERRSHRLCDVDSCAIAHPAINKALADLRRTPPANSSVELEVFSNGSLGRSVDQVQGMEFGFSQINSEVNQMLVSWVLERVTHWKPMHVLDLCAGRGNFTIPLAEALPNTRFTGVELNERAVKTARKLSAHLPHVDWVAEDVERFLMHHEPLTDFGVVLDPPRMGLSAGAVERLGRLNPKQVLWIGCDLQNLVRDIQRLQDVAPQFQIQEVQPFDMFPQTFHVETAVTLTR